MLFIILYLCTFRENNFEKHIRASAALLSLTSLWQVFDSSSIVKVDVLSVEGTTRLATRWLRVLG